MAASASAVAAAAAFASAAADIPAVVFAAVVAGAQTASASCFLSPSRNPTLVVGCDDAAAGATLSWTLRALPSPASSHFCVIFVALEAPRSRHHSVALLMFVGALFAACHLQRPVPRPCPCPLSDLFGRLLALSLRRHSIRLAAYSALRDPAVRCLAVQCRPQSLKTCQRCGGVTLGKLDVNPKENPTAKRPIVPSSTSQTH